MQRKQNTIRYDAQLKQEMANCISLLRRKKLLSYQSGIKSAAPYLNAVRPYIKPVMGALAIGSLFYHGYRVMVLNPAIKQTDAKNIASFKNVWANAQSNAEFSENENGYCHQNIPTHAIERVAAKCDFYMKHDMRDYFYTQCYDLIKAFCKEKITADACISDNIDKFLISIAFFMIVIGILLSSHSVARTNKKHFKLEAFLSDEEFNHTKSLCDKLHIDIKALVSVDQLITLLNAASSKFNQDVHQVPKCIV